MTDSDRSMVEVSNETSEDGEQISPNSLPGRELHYKKELNKTSTIVRHNK
jgi:hypothetical protein